MSINLPATGLRHVEEFTVLTRHTVPNADPEWPGFRDMPAVLATAFMIGFMEQTCIQALRPYLSAEEHTLGIAVDMSHEAATLPGSVVKATVELVKTEGRILHFSVSCSDENGLIGKGSHKRAIVNVERFMQRLTLQKHS
jgi:fluoroacetyl-CoA thioesterase